MNTTPSGVHKTQTATFAGGCFWCTEAIFKRLKGVISVTPGYTGGSIPHPTYEMVSTGSTGHAEAIEITFNPEIISFETLLDVFFHLHDPSTLNQQGADHGTQYRSAIFTHSDHQQESAQKTKQLIIDSGKYTQVVTEIVPASEFYPAEQYHYDYYDKNSYQPYCQVVIDPKIHKLMKEYKPLLKL